MGELLWLVWVLFLFLFLGWLYGGWCEYVV